MQFALDRDIDGAAVDVQTAIAEAMSLLPPRHAGAAVVPQSEPGRSGHLHHRPQLGDAAAVGTGRLRRDAHRARRSPPSTVWRRSTCSAARSTRFACRSIRIGSRRHQIGINEIDAQLQNWNVNLPTGQLFGPTASYQIKASGQLMSADAFRSAGRDVPARALPIRLHQVATVIDSVEDTRSASWFYDPGQESMRVVLMTVMKQPGSNTLAVIDAIKGCGRTSSRSCRRRFI